MVWITHQVPWALSYLSSSLPAMSPPFHLRSSPNYSTSLEVLILNSLVSDSGFLFFQTVHARITMQQFCSITEPVKTWTPLLCPWSPLCFLSLCMWLDLYGSQLLLFLCKHFQLPWPSLSAVMDSQGSSCEWHLPTLPYPSPSNLYVMVCFILNREHRSHNLPTDKPSHLLELYLSSLPSH